MLSRQHNFYQQFLQLTDAFLICLALWTAHAVRFYVLNKIVWYGDFPTEPQFKSCYWMIALALPVGPLVLEYVGFYQVQPPIGSVRSLGRVAWALFLVLVTIFTCVIIVRIPQASISRTALGLFFVFGMVMLTARCAIFNVWLRQRGARVH